MGSAAGGGVCETHVSAMFVPRLCLPSLTCSVGAVQDCRQAYENKTVVVCLPGESSVPAYQTVDLQIPAGCNCLAKEDLPQTATETKMTNETKSSLNPEDLIKNKEEFLSGFEETSSQNGSSATGIRNNSITDELTTVKVTDIKRGSISIGVPGGPVISLEDGGSLVDMVEYLNTATKQVRELVANLNLTTSHNITDGRELKPMAIFYTLTDTKYVTVCPSTVVPVSPFIVHNHTTPGDNYSNATSISSFVTSSPDHHNASLALHTAPLKEETKKPLLITTPSIDEIKTEASNQTTPSDVFSQSTGKFESGDSVKIATTPSTISSDPGNVTDSIPFRTNATTLKPGVADSDNLNGTSSSLVTEPSAVSPPSSLTAGSTSKPGKIIPIVLTDSSTKVTTAKPTDKTSTTSKVTVKPVVTTSHKVPELIEATTLKCSQRDLVTNKNFIDASEDVQTNGIILWRKFAWHFMFDDHKDSVLRQCYTGLNETKPFESVPKRISEEIKDMPKISGLLVAVTEFSLCYHKLTSCRFMNKELMAKRIAISQPISELLFINRNTLFPYAAIDIIDPAHYGLNYASMDKITTFFGFKELMSYVMSDSEVVEGMDWTSPMEWDKQAQLMMYQHAVLRILNQQHDVLCPAKHETTPTTTRPAALATKPAATAKPATVKLITSPTLVTKKPVAEGLPAKESSSVKENSTSEHDGRKFMPTILSRPELMHMLNA